MAVPQVAIIGRPNVGKSSIFNWLAGRRIAIVDPTAGVTRDRVTALVKAGDRYFELVDTGGMGLSDAESFGPEIGKQIEQAIADAEVILFVVDVQTGLVPLDEEVNKRLRYVSKPVICVANKCDSLQWDTSAAEFYRLGRGKHVCTSPSANRGKHELLELILERLPGEPATAPSEPVMKLAIVGKRNVGKSTIINCLARAERMIVSEIPGTTRDSVDVRFELDGKPFIAIDTPGVRREKSLESDVEFYGLARAEQSIRRADVVLLLFDPVAKISKPDKDLAHYISEQYKPCIFVVNKWDRMLPLPTGKYANYLRDTFKAMPYVPVAFITAKTGKNVKALINLAQSLFKQSAARVPTARLNRVLRHALEQNPPPPRENRTPKIYYGTQVATAPPTIVLFCSEPGLLDASYLRYLLNVFRLNFPFHEIPMKLYVRRHDKRPRPAEAAEETSSR